MPGLAPVSQPQVSEEEAVTPEPETIQALKAKGITHVYIGQKGGNLPVEVLLESDAYELAYHKDRVWIFDVR